MEQKSFLMRVALPMSPQCKTAGEVATLRWVRENTSIPVAAVLAFDDSRDNEIGFEWMLIERMAGSTLGSQWQRMSIQQKMILVERIAGFQAQLLRQSARFGAIGTLDIKTAEMAEHIKANKQPLSLSKSAPVAISPGPLVALAYMKPNIKHNDIPRGPFYTEHDWLSSLLEAIIQENSAIIKRIRQKQRERIEMRGDGTSDDDDDDVDDEELYINNAQRLLKFLPCVFNRDIMSTALLHNDLSRSNILVDDKGAITAIVDWECVSTLPLWAVAAAMPKFIRGPTRDEEPARDSYADVATSENDAHDHDNKGKCELYWEHLDNYECTKLREAYIFKLCQLWPDQTRIQDWLKADVLKAVESCDTPFVAYRIAKWLDQIEDGEMVGLHDV